MGPKAGPIHKKCVRNASFPIAETKGLTRKVVIGTPTQQWWGGQTY